MSEQVGVLPSVFVYGSQALDDRHMWHISFDIAVLEKWNEHQNKERKKAQREAEAKANAQRLARGWR